MLTSTLRSGCLSTASVAEATQSRSPGVSSAAFRAQPPDLRFAPLMDMDFAVSCPLVRRWRLVPGFCPSTRTFAIRFLQTPPRGDSPCVLASPSPPSGWAGDFHPQAAEHAQHTTKPLRGNWRSSTSSVWRDNCNAIHRHYRVTECRVRIRVRWSTDSGGSGPASEHWTQGKVMLDEVAHLERNPHVAAALDVQWYYRPNGSSAAYRLRSGDRQTFQDISGRF
jgi:hypothetical protein